MPVDDNGTSRERAAARSRLVRAAGEQIAERGWSSATSRAVSGRAGVNNGLVHYYFGAFDGLLFEAVAQAFETEVSGGMRMVLRPDDPAGGCATSLRGCELAPAIW